MNKTVKTLWVSSGILVFLWTAYWFIKVSNEPGIVGNVLKYTLGMYLLILYIIIAIVYWINKRMYKRRAKRLRRK
jgi:hypothetical protein